MAAQTVFFDIGETLGEPRLSPPPDLRLERLDVYPRVAEVLAGLRSHGIRLGIISNIGDPTPARVAAVGAALAAAGLADFFVEELLIWGRKDNLGIFTSAVAQDWRRRGSMRVRRRGCVGTTVRERSRPAGGPASPACPCRRAGRGFALRAGDRAGDHCRR